MTHIKENKKKIAEGKMGRNKNRHAFERKMEKN
jgi:hypothetical protein